IGLMYTHAHLRYAEALWRYGDARGFFRALCRANPIGIRELVPSVTLRQSNCYYSSSDAAFADRYEAYAEYDRAMRGNISLGGGQLFYARGAGCGMSLFLRCSLGVGGEKRLLVVDRVIPGVLEGLQTELEMAGGSCGVTSRIAGAGCGPTAV